MDHDISELCHHGKKVEKSERKLLLANSIPHTLTVGKIKKQTATHYSMGE